MVRSNALRENKNSENFFLYKEDFGEVSVDLTRFI